MIYYFVGVVVSAILWFLLIKLRQRGFYIPMPGADGNLLDPMNRPDVDYKIVMVGWVVFSVIWPLSWAFFVLCFALSCIIALLQLTWEKTLGNEKVIKKIFSIKEREDEK